MVHAGDSKVRERLAEGLLLVLTNHMLGRNRLVADLAAGAFWGERLPNYGTMEPGHRFCGSSPEGTAPEPILTGQYSGLGSGSARQPGSDSKPGATTLPRSRLPQCYYRQNLTSPPSPGGEHTRGGFPQTRKSDAMSVIYESQMTREADDGGPKQANRTKSQHLTVLGACSAELPCYVIWYHNCGPREPLWSGLGLRWTDILSLSCQKKDRVGDP